MRSNNKKAAKGQNNKKNSPKGPSSSPATRFTVDDPKNDIFDDEIFDEETVIPKEKIEEQEKFEKPW